MNQPISKKKLFKLLKEAYPEGFYLIPISKEHFNELEFRRAISVANDCISKHAAQLGVENSMEIQNQILRVTNTRIIQVK